MRILAVSQYYWPEPFNVADICEELAARGHEVTVLTGIPNYPEGDVYPGYDAKRGMEEERNGVRIVRASMAPRRKGPVNRVRNYYSFSRNGSSVVQRLGPGFDAVLSFEISPVMSANPAIAYAEAFGAPLLLYVIDIWPECLLAGGIRRSSAVYKHFSKVSAHIYSVADMLAVTSPSFEGYIGHLLGESIEVVNLPQYAEDGFSELPEPDPTLDAAMFRDGKLHLMFAGNVGSAQSVETLVRAAALVRDDATDFHVVGSGSSLDGCMSLAKDLGADNVFFHGRHPIEEMPAYYAKADAMVATFADNPVLGYTLPRKIQSYMAAGKPVIGTVTGEARRVLEEAGCGFCCDAEDAEGLASCCRRMAAATPLERMAYGDRARDYCARHYSRESFFKTLTEALKALKGTKHGKH